MLRKQKGQGMTEFALILPLLLLLLLGVIEAGWIIWSFINVQQAAREGARYAVTGRPWLDGSGVAIPAQLDTCLGIDPEADPFAGSAEPWLCEDTFTQTTTIPPEVVPYNPRVEAIKEITLSQGRNLPITEECVTVDQFHGRNGETCNQTPGAFGVFVQGQVTTETITSTKFITVENHPGWRGLNVQVNTFYNWQPFTPVFDAILGGNYIQLQGRVQLQNEGLDAAAGIEPPPGIVPPPDPNDPTGGDPPPTAFIWPVNGWRFSATGAPIIHLEDHDPGVIYDVWLEDIGNPGTPFLLCDNVLVGVTGAADETCLLGPLSIPVGFYDLFSTEDGFVTPHAADAANDFEIIPGGDPFIEVADGTIWAAGDSTDVTLGNHAVVTGTKSYDVRLYDPAGTLLLQTLRSNHTGISTDVIDWLVPDVSACPAIGMDFCTIKSFLIDTSDSSETEIASVQVKLNQPRIVMDPPGTSTDPYIGGQVVEINLRGHTPFQRFDVAVPPGGIKLPSDDTNAVGNTSQPIFWQLPQDCGSGGNLSSGSYTATSHPFQQTDLITTSDVFWVSIDPDPHLTIDGGNTWNVGSTISIRVLQHVENTEHYLHDFDGNRIRTGPTSDTFITGSCGDAVISFTIPPTTTAGIYTIRSFDEATGIEQATIDINVLAKPFIRVVEGDVVMPGQTITIEGTSHKPDDNYAVYYANKLLQGVLADSNGAFSFTYDLNSLPTTPPPDLTDFNNLGIPYILKSQTVVAPITDVATTTLTIQGADLAVTQVNVQPVAPLSSTVDVDIVVQNTLPVTINRFVDVDFYNLQIPDPDPFGPSYLQGYNFPGDIKFWKNTVLPNEVFTFSHQIQLSELGLNSMFGYADVSNSVFENEGPGEVANPNNINSAPTLVNCPAIVTSDNFSSGALAGWTLTDYGDANSPAPSATASGILELRSAGSSTWQANDNNGGQSLLYQTNPFTTSFGLDVQVKLSHVDMVGAWAKGGIEIRDSLNPTSPRVTFGVARNNGKPSQPRQVMQAGFRDTGQSMDWVGGQSYWLNNHTVDLDLPAPGVPIWLRITRESGPDGAFNFYYKQSATAPPPPDDDDAQLTYWAGTLAESVSISGIGESVVVGLFNSSYSASNPGTSEFDDFSIAVGSGTQCAQSGAGQLPFPPKYLACNQALDKTSFEGTAGQVASAWGQNFSGTNIPVTGDSHSGLQFAKAETYGGSVGNPHFWQRFTMPDWVISSTTTLDVDLFRKVIDNPPFGSQAGDQFKVMVTDQPGNVGNWDANPITDPAIVGQGDQLFGNWTQLPTLTLPVAAGVNLEDYANQDLYIHFFNNSNATNSCGGSLCSTQYQFDDVELTTCTQQPEPSPIATQITGQLTLHFSNGTSEALPFVRVWAYAQGAAQGTQPVYETFTIQNGEFNFYNIPMGTYTIYAQYNLVEGTQIETLAADTTVILDATNNPAQTFLNLYTLGPLP